jgi:hypothetical protein
MMCQACGTFGHCKHCVFLLASKAIHMQLLDRFNRPRTARHTACVTQIHHTPQYARLLTVYCITVHNKMESRIK